MSNKSVTDKLKAELYPALMAGAVGFTVANYMGSGEFTVDMPILGLQRGDVALALTAAGGHLGGAVLADWVAPQLQGNSYIDAESKFLPPVAAGVATYATVMAISTGLSLANSKSL